MFEKPEIVRMAQELAAHAGARQAEIARNVANADTPGYRARDLADFASVYSSDRTQTMRSTRAGHLPAPGTGATGRMFVDAGTETAPNGNTVSLETEMMKSAEVRQQHGLALAVYKSSLDMMRAAIGRGR